MQISDIVGRLEHCMNHASAEEATKTHEALAALHRDIHQLPEGIAPSTDIALQKISEPTPEPEIPDATLGKPEPTVDG